MKSLFTKKKKEIQDIQNTPSIPQIEAFNVEEFLNFLVSVWWHHDYLLIVKQYSENRKYAFYLTA